MSNKTIVVGLIVVAIIVAAGIFMAGRPLSEPDGSATPATNSTIQSGSGTQSQSATGNPDDAVNIILNSASEEQTAASVDAEADSITSSDSSINAFEGVYNANEF